MERPGLVIAVLALVAAALWLTYFALRPRDASNDFIGPPRSDYTLGQFTLDALDIDGKHAFTVVAPHLVRSGSDGSIYITTPDYEIADNAGNLWKGVSESAWVDKDGDVMKLEGKVAMHREPTPRAERIDLETSDLTVTSDPKPKDAKGHTIPGGPPRDKRMQTQAPTMIRDPTTISQSVGMKADLDLKTVELLSDVHTISYPGKLSGKLQ